MEDHSKKQFKINLLRLGGVDNENGFFIILQYIWAYYSWLEVSGMDSRLNAF